MALLKNALSMGARSIAKSQARTFTNNVAIKKWAYNLSGFNQYGLYHDDVLQETPEVKEAIRRLPANIQDERAFRIQRAVQVLSFVKWLMLSILNIKHFALWH